MSYPLLAYCSNNLLLRHNSTTSRSYYYTLNISSYFDIYQQEWIIIYLQYSMNEFCLGCCIDTTTTHYYLLHSLMHAWNTYSIFNLFVVFFVILKLRFRSFSALNTSYWLMFDLLSWLYRFSFALIALNTKNRKDNCYCTMRYCGNLYTFWILMILI